MPSYTHLTNQSQFVQAGAVFAGTNATGTIASNGISISVNAGGGGGPTIQGSGTYTQGTGTIQFNNSNGVTFGLSSNGVMTGSVATNYQSQGAYLTTAMASNAGSNFVGLNSALTANGVSATINSSGVSLNFPAFLTTADLSQNSSKYAGINGAITGGSITMNTSGVSINLPAYLTTAQPVGAYLTTADLSQNSSKYAGINGAITGGSITLNTSGVSINLPAYLTTAQPVGAYLTTAMSSNRGSDFLNVSGGFSGTNISGTLASNGLQLSVAAGGGGGVAMQGSGTYTQNTGTIQFNNSNGVTFGLSNNGVMTASVAAAGGAQTGISGIAGSGASTVTVGTVQFANGNNVTFGLNGNTMTASASYPAQTAFVFSNSNGVSFGTNGSTITATVATNYQSQGAYLTTARASNDAIGLNSALTANGVSMTANSSGLSLNFPAFLTTAMQSASSSVFAKTGFTSASTAGSDFAVTLNTVGLSMGIPKYLTTAMQTGSQSQLWIMGNSSATIGGTNISGTMYSNGMSLSAAAGGGVSPAVSGSNGSFSFSTLSFGNLNGLSFYTSNGSIVGSYTDAGAGAGISAVVISAGGANGALSNFSFADSNGISFGLNGSTITASAAGGGGGAATVGGYELWPPLGGNTAFSTFGLGTIYFQKFVAPVNFSFNNIERRYSGSTVSSAISAQAAHTVSYGLYSLGTGASSSIYNLIGSSQIFMQASYSSNLSAGFTISQGAGSYTVSSAGTVGQSALTGFKHMYMPFTSTLTAGGNYAVAMNMSSATTGATGPLRIAFQELSVINNLTIGKLYASTILATNASFVGDYAQGVYSATSAGLPATLAISGLTNAVSQQRMYLQFEA